MSPIQNFEQHSSHLAELDLPIQTRLQMTMEVRDGLEIAHTAEYLNFLKCYFQAFSVILLQITKPQFIDNPEHKLRNFVVEILNRLPHSEVIRPFVQDLLRAFRENRDEIWLEHAVSCFLQGMKFGVSNSRSHLAQVLYLLSFDTPNEPVGRALDKYLNQIPHWVWLSWIPQLFLSLQRVEAPHCKLVLLKIATVYPQALYYWLRTYLFERQDVANKSELGRLAMAQQRMQQNVSGSGSLGISDGMQGNLKGLQAQQLRAVSMQGMTDLCNKILQLSMKVVLLTEIGSRFVTLPEERLLAVVNALHHRWYKYPTATTEEVPQSLKKELSGVCRACFSADADTFAAILKLEEESRVLRDFNVVDVEVPGQYFSTQVRMVEDDLMYGTFLKVYENHCARNDREADLPITYFKEQLNQAISGPISRGRFPNKIPFAKNTGKFFQTDFHPAYDANGMIEFNEPVPSCLTRNMQAFFSHFGVEGFIVSTMCAAAQAVVSPKQSQHLWHQLTMFFRDELLSWSLRGVTELVEAALTPRNLRMMDPAWHPWS
ncbi:hypothetical protein GH714_015837 [Hevea brasiliensis]|uniref:FAT domain-containing protein n=1 Tax=Hevea brasiliensis TaxID=3981 RepID=A0A6A6KQR5_HEVBR|nr:hypothetical protein GH714_015837 [Hevea brasiliensis]